jgi:hypothetical protein
MAHTEFLEVAVGLTMNEVSWQPHEEEVIP